MNAELSARITAATAVLADYQAAVDSAPLSKPPGPEWTLRLALALGGLLAVVDELTGATGPAPASVDADGLVTITAGVTLEAAELATVLGALEDGQTYRMHEAAQFCGDCETHPAGACDDCAGDIETAQAYHDLAARLLGGGAR